MSPTRRAGLIRATVLIGSLTLALPALAQSEPRPPVRTIVMQGTAEVAVTPDLAVFQAGTLSRARTAREAMDANSRTMRAVLDALRQAGVEERDIATSALSLQPTIEYARGTNRPRVTGYAAGHTLTVRVRDLAKLGDALDRAVEAGATEVQGLQLTLADMQKRIDEARVAAVQDAKRKAEILVGAAGARIGPVRSVQEHSAPQRQAEAYGSVPQIALSSSAPVPVATGERMIRSTVTVSWDLVD